MLSYFYEMYKQCDTRWMPNKSVLKVVFIEYFLYDTKSLHWKVIKLKTCYRDQSLMINVLLNIPVWYACYGLFRHVINYLNKLCYGYFETKFWKKLIA